MTATTAVALLTVAAVLACASGQGRDRGVAANRGQEAAEEPTCPDDEAVVEHDRAPVIASASASDEAEPCAAVEWWFQAPWPTPAADSVNCLVTTLPEDTRGFVWSNNWYVQPDSDHHCPVGNFDGANCYVGSAPAGTAAFVWEGKAYFTPQRRPEARG
ncbi:MAG: hypothetical protein AAF799_23410 [Myxococcota bacterium]